MKLRIHGNSLRLRISPSEITQILSEGQVRQHIQFAGPSRLEYILEAASVPALTVSFDGSAIRVAVPTGRLREWASGGDITIEETCSADNEHPLSVLIEKDFACLHRTGESEEDRFPNPAGSGKF